MQRWCVTVNHVFDAASEMPVARAEAMFGLFLIVDFVALTLSLSWHGGETFRFLEPLFSSRAR